MIMIYDHAYLKLWRIRVSQWVEGVSWVVERYNTNKYRLNLFWTTAMNYLFWIVGGSEKSLVRRGLELFLFIQRSSRRAVRARRCWLGQSEDLAPDVGAGTSAALWTPYAVWPACGSGLELLTSLSSGATRNAASQGVSSLGTSAHGRRTHVAVRQGGALGWGHSTGWNPLVHRRCWPRHQGPDVAPGGGARGRAEVGVQPCWGSGTWLVYGSGGPCGRRQRCLRHGDVWWPGDDVGLVTSWWCPHDDSGGAGVLGGVRGWIL